MPLLISILLLLFMALAPPTLQAGAYFSRAEALKMAFPEADRVETVHLYLTDEERQNAARQAGAPIESIYTVYAGKKGEETTGYAVIEAAVVRTQPETLLVVLEPDATVRFIEVLAFFEPEEYKTSGRWLDQFRGRPLTPGLRVGGDIQGITGATLSAHAVVRQVRRSAALVTLLQER